MACYLSARLQTGRSLQLEIRFHGALQQVPCCAADMQKMHILSHWFFTKIKRFVAPNGRRKTARILAEMRRSRPTYAPVALAPPKRSFQRGMTSRLYTLSGMPPLSCGDHRARGPGHALPQLAPSV